MSTPVQRFSPFVKQCFVTAAVCCNVIGNAATLGFPAILLPQLQQPGSALTHTTNQASWLTSSTALAALLGCLVSVHIMHRLGRRAAHIVVTIPAIIGWILTFFASGFTMLLIGRIQQSVSLGISLGIRSVIIGEYTSAKYRGVFLAAILLSQAFGIFLVHLVGSFVGWRITALVCLSFPVIALVMTLFYPESPNHLASKGKYNESREAFRWLRGDGEEVELEELIQAKLDADQNRRQVKENLTSMRMKKLYKPILIMVHAHAMMQFAGGATMAAYSTEIIEVIIGTDANSSIWMIILDAQRIISSCLAIYFIHKLRRRILTFCTGILCILSHIAIAGYLCGKISGLKYDAVWIGILLLNFQTFSVATGMIPLPNVITGEILPPHYRIVGNTISAVSGALTVFLVLKFFPALVQSAGLHVTYFVYAGVLAYFLLVIWILLPETKEKPWQEIEDKFRRTVLTPQEMEIRQSLQRNESPRAKPVPSMISFG